MATIGSLSVSVYPQAPVPTSNQVPFVKELAISKQLSFINSHRLCVWCAFEVMPSQFHRAVLAQPERWGKSCIAWSRQSLVYTCWQSMRGTRRQMREKDVRGIELYSHLLRCHTIYRPLYTWRQPFTSHQTCSSGNLIAVPVIDCPALESRCLEKKRGCVDTYLKKQRTSEVLRVDYCFRVESKTKITASSSTGTLARSHTTEVMPSG